MVVYLIVVLSAFNIPSATGSPSASYQPTNLYPSPTVALELAVAPTTSVCVYGLRVAMLSSEVFVQPSPFFTWRTNFWVTVFSNLA